ncbi:MAG: hypothetical protein HOQ34_04435 [Gemmatimonadaceae bacterium]|nr:hypothetical protein [Gemmatimonadaceae bacterium]
MSAGKNVLRRAASAVISASYNQGGQTVTYPGDAFHVHDDFEFLEQYQFDGARAGTAAGSSVQLRDAKAGRFLDVELAHRVRPGGAAYSASVVPTIDRWLRAHGMTKTLVTTVGSESVTYKAFTDGTWESLYGELYAGKDLGVYTGGYVYKWVHTAADLGVPVFAFNLKATMTNRISDAAVPTISAYPNANVAHPKGAGSTLTINANSNGAFQGKVRSATLTSERTIDDRQGQSETVMGSTASGHAGFQLGRYTQTLEITVESTATRAANYSSATLLDPERCAEEATPCAIAYQVGLTQYNRYKFTSSNWAQIVEAKRDKAGAIRLWNLTIQLTPSSEVNDDGLSVVFD